jgi:uncharacterized protein involved in propanediol utilization
LEDHFLSGYSGSANLSCGTGFSIGHAGELLQGVISSDGSLEPFLVTLPAPCFTSHATILISNDPADVVHPTWKTKALRAARIAWTHLRGEDGSLHLNIDSQTPVGRGCGSSTSDCVATIRAVADLLRCSISANQIANWCSVAETAADATMFHHQPVAFCQRRGKILSTLGTEYPPMRVVVADLGGPPVDTLTRQMPPYTGVEINRFQDLLLLLEKSVQRNDAMGVARVATESAAIHQKHYLHPRWRDFVATVRTTGALGIGCSHSGTVAVALLAPGHDTAEDQLVRHLEDLGLPVLTRYELVPESKGEAIACLSF